MIYSINDHLNWCPDEYLTRAEAERDAPTEREVARAQRERGASPVSAHDFGVLIHPDNCACDDCALF